MQNAPPGAFCNTFDLHLAIIGIENQVLVFFLSDRLRLVLLNLDILTGVRKAVVCNYKSVLFVNITYYMSMML